MSFLLPGFYDKKYADETKEMNILCATTWLEAIEVPLPLVEWTLITLDPFFFSVTLSVSIPLSPPSLSLSLSLTANSGFKSFDITFGVGAAWAESKLSTLLSLSLGQVGFC